VKGEEVKVLVVDDAAANRLVLCALLKRLGHEVLAASNAAEARRLFSDMGPEAVLTDLHLGDGEDGVALAESLRRLSGERRVRIALMTADAVFPAGSDGLFDAILEKPVSFEALKSFLEDVK